MHNLIVSAATYMRSLLKGGNSELIISVASSGYLVKQICQACDQALVGT